MPSKPSWQDLKPAEVLKNHAVDAVVPEKLEDAARPFSTAPFVAISIGKVDGPKDRPLSLGMIEAMMCFTTPGIHRRQSGKNYPPHWKL